MKNTGTLKVTAPSDREITLTRVVDAPRRLVFEAWTNPEHVPHWMLGPSGWTMPVCEIDLRPGGAWHFVWRRSDGTEMEMRGVYREITSPERLVSTESWGGDWPETINTLILSEEAGKTTISLRVLYPPHRRHRAPRQVERQVHGKTLMTTNTKDRLAGSMADCAQTQVKKLGRRTA